MGATGGSLGLPTNLQPQYEYNGNMYYAPHYKQLSKSKEKRGYFEQLPGGVNDAKKFFDRITGGSIHEEALTGDYSGLVRYMANGDKITFRIDSKYGGPTVEINRRKRHIGPKAKHIEKIHFITNKKEKK